MAEVAGKNDVLDAFVSLEQGLEKSWGRIVAAVVHEENCPIYIERI